MNRSITRLILIGMTLMLVFTLAPAAWADYGAGRSAWEASRYAEALREWRQAARKGDKRAMVALGRAFMKGLGVPQDFVEAHKWFNLAAARGDAKAVAERDALAKEMTVEERAEARKLLRAWRNAGRRRTTATPSRRRAPGTPRPPRRIVRKRPAGNAALRATEAGDVSALEKALAAGADPNARGRRGWTPLMHAADKGYKLLVPPLLAAGAKPDLRAADGATALFIAALHGRSEIIELLTKADADPSIKGPKGRTAEGLMTARVARTKYGGAKGLHKALRANERPAVIRALLDLGADMNFRDKDGNRPLHVAVEKSNPELAKLLLDHGADVNAKGKYSYTPLYRAVQNNNFELAKLLLDRGANVNLKVKNGYTPLHIAAHMDNPKVVKLLLDHGADVNARNTHNGYTPLLFVAGNTNPQVVKLLLDHKAKVNVREDILGQTVLHVAAEENQYPEVVKLLLDHGANVNAVDKQGRTPLHRAKTQNKTVILNWARRQNVTTQSSDPQGPDNTDNEGD